LNEGAGGIARDIVRNYNGTLTNMASPGTSTSGWTVGRFGRGVAFDNSNDAISLPTSTFFDITTQVTIAVWAKQTTNGDVVLCCRNVAGSEGYELRASRASSDKFNFVVVISGSAKIATGNTGVNASVNKWMHIVGTFGRGNVNIYVNGILEGTTAASGSCRSTSGAAMGIGRDVANSLNSYAGVIDHCMIWNRELYAGEIMKLYTDPFCIIESPRRRIISQVVSATTGRLLALRRKMVTA